MSQFLDEFCLRSVSEHSVDTEWTKGNEGAERRLREFPGLRKGSTGAKTHWREAEVPGTADARHLSQGSGSGHENSKPSRHYSHREGQMGEGQTDWQTVSLRRMGTALESVGLRKGWWVIMGRKGTQV